MRKIFLGILALFFFAGTASAQVVSSGEQPRTFRVPFHTVNSMILLDAKVNGKAAVLLLDTGANRTALSAEITGADKREAQIATHNGLFLTHTVDLKVGEHIWANWHVLNRRRDAALANEDRRLSRRRRAAGALGGAHWPM